MPCTCDSFTIDEEVVMVVSRLMDKAVWANSLGLVWLAPASLDSELKQSVGKISLMRCKAVKSSFMLNIPTGFIPSLLVSPFFNDSKYFSIISVADKMRTSISFSFRRPVRGGVESQQHDHLSVKDVRIFLDEAFLPKMKVPTRWIKGIPIKANVFAWKLFLDRLPTRSNLA
nr:RNA-directed DNA polymerase, eukaryota [Tanacetum cinerariifolium]